MDNLRIVIVREFSPKGSLKDQIRKVHCIIFSHDVMCCLRLLLQAKAFKVDASVKKRLTRISEKHIIRWGKQILEVPNLRCLNSTLLIVRLGNDVFGGGGHWNASHSLRKCYYNA